jgi:hypothetical protein
MSVECLNSKLTVFDDSRTHAIQFTKDFHHPDINYFASISCLSFDERSSDYNWRR